MSNTRSCVANAHAWNVKCTVVVGLKSGLTFLAAHQLVSETLYLLHSHVAHPGRLDGAIQIIGDDGSRSRASLDL